MIDQSKNREQQSYHIYYSLFFTSFSKLNKYAGEKPFSEAKSPEHKLSFFLHPILMWSVTY
jgi:hypothetical protein